MKRLCFPLFVVLALSTWAQKDYIALSGRVTCGSKGVPYATLQLAGTSLGVSCNETGEYELRVPLGTEKDTVVVRCMGYSTAHKTVRELMRSGRVKLEEHAVVLKEVAISDYRYPRDLLEAAVGRIAENYHGDSSYSTFFFRDWRAVDNELYLFDEAVIRMKRAGYSEYVDKSSYRFRADEREMPTDYKMLLKHRLLVYDRQLLVDKTGRQNGASEMLEYDDNESFFDPVYAPQASLLFNRRMMEVHRFAAMSEFENNGEKYYYLESKILGGNCRYEYTIRKRDLAIVQIKSVQTTRSERWHPSGDWVNWVYNRLTFDKDSSLWSYDVRDGHYTLTHYYNYKLYHLSPRKNDQESEPQWWQSCVDWTLTDFSLSDTATRGDTIVVRPQTLQGAFGASDNAASFWGRYNSVVADTLPLRLLLEKLQKIHTYENK